MTTDIAAPSDLERRLLNLLEEQNQRLDRLKAAVAALEANVVALAGEVMTSERFAKRAHGHTFTVSMPE